LSTARSACREEHAGRRRIVHFWKGTEAARPPSVAWPMAASHDDG
jgi:hypothetical protein